MDELTVGIADATVAMAAALTPARVASGTTRMRAYVVRERERVINKKKKTYNVCVVTVWSSVVPRVARASFWSRDDDARFTLAILALARDVFAR
jgi:hypothetical protein